MMKYETAKKLKELKLPEVIDIIERQDQISEVVSMTFNERLDMTIDDLYLLKNQGRINRLIKQSQITFPQADIHSMMYSTERGLDQTVIVNLSVGTYISAHLDVAFYGATGSGKTYAACALAKQACRQCLKTLYIRQPDLFDKYFLLPSQGKERLRLLSRLASYDLLVIDEWLKDVPSEEQTSMLFELVEKRSDRKATIFCSQFAPSDWILRMGESVKAEGICDRIIHNMVSVDFGSFNMRQYEATVNPKKWH